MGHIRPGDEDLHLPDWSHRWCGGPADPKGQEAFQAELRAHMEAHRLGEDMPRRWRESPPPPARRPKGAG